MKQLAWLAATLAIAGAARADGPPSDKDVVAARAMSVLISFEEGPRVMTMSCKDVDPPGDPAREKLFEAWKRENKDLFAKIDGYAKDVLPPLYSTLGGDSQDDVVKSFRGKKIVDASKEIYGLDPDQKKQMCQQYSKATWLDKDKTQATTKQAFDILDAWKKDHDQGSTL